MFYILESKGFMRYTYIAPVPDYERAKAAAHALCNLNNKYPKEERKIFVIAEEHEIEED